jgi:hypothetical protein
MSSISYVFLFLSVVSGLVDTVEAIDLSVVLTLPFVAVDRALETVYNKWELHAYLFSEIEHSSYTGCVLIKEVTI